MPSGNEKRLLLLCGAGILATQLAAMAGSVTIQDPLPAATAQEASCFVAGTMVLMADGSERPIETVRPGDRVLGRRGRINRVLGCERTRLGRRRLYGFNERRPFVTAEHPFLTAEGWKALDPEATLREACDLPVLPLQVGDRLCRGIGRRLERGGEDRGLVFLHATTVLETIAAVASEAAMPVFNLLLDGDHSYVADGWIVHNKDAVPSNPASGPAATEEGDGISSTTPPPGGHHAPSEAPSGSVDALLKDMGFTSSRDAGLAPAGPPLSPDQEQSAIKRQWHPSE
jgi:hypothetical protein